MEKSHKVKRSSELDLMYVLISIVTIHEIKIEANFVFIGMLSTETYTRIRPTST